MTHVLRLLKIHQGTLMEVKLEALDGAGAWELHFTLLLFRTALSREASRGARGQAQEGLPWPTGVSPSHANTGKEWSLSLTVLAFPP